MARHMQNVATCRAVADPNAHSLIHQALQRIHRHRIRLRVHTTIVQCFADQLALPHVATWRAT